MAKKTLRYREEFDGALYEWRFNPDDRTSTDRHTAVKELRGGWTCEMQFARQNGRWVVAAVSVSPRREPSSAPRRPSDFDVASVPAGGVTTRVLRRVPLGSASPIRDLEFLDKSFKKIAESRSAIQIAQRQEKVLRRQIRRLKGKARLALVASEYVRVLQSGRRDTNAVVAKKLGMSVSQVRDAVRIARQKDLLTPTRQRGVGGGELTPQARDLLASVRRVESRPRLRKIYDQI